MTTDNNYIFAWQNFIFIAYIFRSELVLRWRNVNSVLLSSVKGTGIDKHDNESQQSSSSSRNVNVFVSQELVLENPAKTLKKLSREKDTVETHVYDKISLNLERWKHCEVVTGGFSFDHNFIQRVPVLLLQCEKESDIIEYVFIQVKYTPSCLNGSNFAQASSVDAKPRSTSPEFTLFPIRSYSLNNFTSFQSPPVFLSNLQLLLINSDPCSVSFKLCTQDTFSHHNLIKDFEFVSSYKNMLDVQILDSFSVIEDRTIITIISFKTDEGLTNCQCMKFTPNVVFTSQTANENYDMTQLPIDLLFASDYAEVLKVVKISSFSSRFNLISKSPTFKTSAVIITHTGYILKFNDGVLFCCLNLFEHRDTCRWHLDDWACAVVKVINFDECSERTAVQVNSVCHLIDWTKQKILRSWPSVLTAVITDLHSCGTSSLLLVFEPENEYSSRTLNLHLLEEAEVRLVDVEDEYQSDEEVNDCRAVTVNSDMTRNEKTCTDDHISSQPMCAVNALLAQEKKCEEAVTEMRSELRSKLSFMSATWQQLSNLHINQALPQKTFLDESPLAVLLEGSFPKCHEQDSGDKYCLRHGTSQSCKRFLDFGTFWKRIVDSLLVIGVSVENVSESSVTDIYLTCLPTSECHSSIFQTTSRLSPSTQSELSNILEKSGNSLHSKIQRGSLDQNSDLNRKCLLSPGHSMVVTCTADISQTLSSADLTFHVYSSYTVPSHAVCPGEILNNIISEKNIEEYCTELIVTSHEMLNETYTIKIKSDDPDVALTATDLIALDSLQENMILIVQSAVSSVTCLSLKLTSHSSVRYLKWAEQFLVMNIHWLNYCRIQILKQYSKHRTKIKIFARSKAQVLLLIKFLYSLLPEDITITPDTSTNMSAVTHTGQTILCDVQSRINAVKQQIDHLTIVAPSSEESMPQDGPLSPKFHTARRFKTNLTVSGEGSGSGVLNMDTST